MRNDLLHVSDLEMSNLTYVKMETEGQGGGLPDEVCLHLTNSAKDGLSGLVYITLILFPYLYP